jgi:hypothetical protein
MSGVRVYFVGEKKVVGKIREQCRAPHIATILNLTPNHNRSGKRTSNRDAFVPVAFRVAALHERAPPFVGGIVRQTSANDLNIGFELNDKGRVVGTWKNGNPLRGLR